VFERKAVRDAASSQQAPCDWSVSKKVTRGEKLRRLKKHLREHLKVDLPW